MRNYYEILKVSKNATETEIKKNYRELAKKWHPDRNSSPNSHGIFIEINEAYEILIDSKKRAEFDKIFFGKQDVKISNEFNDWQKGAKQKAENYANMDFDIFKKRILDEVKLVAEYSTNFGCLAFILLGVISGISLIIDAALDGNKDLVQVGFFTLIFYGGICFWLYPKLTGGYKEERKNLKK